MYELEATAFRNFGITKFFFPSETLFNRSKPFSCSQPRTKFISSHLNSSIVIDAILDSAHMFNYKKNSISRPPISKFPTFHSKKKIKFPPSSNTKQANSPNMPGPPPPGCSVTRLSQRLLPNVVLKFYQIGFFFTKHVQILCF